MLVQLFPTTSYVDVVQAMNNGATHGLFTLQRSPTEPLLSFPLQPGAVVQWRPVESGELVFTPSMPLHVLYAPDITWWIAAYDGHGNRVQVHSDGTRIDLASRVVDLPEQADPDIPAQIADHVLAAYEATAPQPTSVYAERLAAWAEPRGFVRSYEGATAWEIAWAHTTGFGYITFRVCVGGQDYPYSVVLETGNGDDRHGLNIGDVRTLDEAWRFYEMLSAMNYDSYRGGMGVPALRPLRESDGPAALGPRALALVSLRQDVREDG